MKLTKEQVSLIETEISNYFKNVKGSQETIAFGEYDTSYMKEQSDCIYVEFFVGKKRYLADVHLLKDGTIGWCY